MQDRDSIMHGIKWLESDIVTLWWYSRHAGMCCRVCMA